MSSPDAGGPRRRNAGRDPHQGDLLGGKIDPALTTRPNTSTRRGGARPITQAVVLLSPPPSTNALYLVRGRRRVKAPAYRRWLHTAGWELVTQRPRRILGPWSIEIVLPCALRGDPDNRIKPILDVLVKHGVVADDRFCRRVSIEKSSTDNVVHITVRAAP